MKKRAMTYRFFAVVMAALLMVGLAPAAELAIAEPSPPYTSSWPAYVGSRSTTALTPTSESVTNLKWTYNFVGTQDWAMVSEPIVVDNYVFLAANSTLYKINRQDGTLAGETALAASIDYTCRPLYAEGLVVVPLSGGRLQAFTADTLSNPWTTVALPDDPTYGAHQSLSTLTYADGYVLMATAIADWTTTYSGVVQSVNIQTGVVRWPPNLNTTSGYYWTGATQVGNYIYIADDAGTLYALAAGTGTTLDTETLGAGVRSTVMADGNVIYVVSTDGVLHKVALAPDGTFDSTASVSFAASSTSTPTIAAGKIFVGGMQADYSGLLAVIDATTLEVIQSVDAPAEVKSAPVVSVQGSETYAYFTYNAEPGGVMVYRLGDTAATDLLVPFGDDANWCMASLAAAEDGTLYYTNDSGNLFALATTPTDSAWTRLAGADRYRTAAEIVKTGWTQSDTVIVATGKDFPDALSASALAGVYDAPVVFVTADSIPADTEALLTGTLQPKNIIIVGGPAAVSEATKTKLASLTGAQVSRYYGNDRYATALDIYEHGLTDWGTTAIVVCSSDFADALSIAPYAFAEKAPVFLTDKTSGLDAATAAAINSGGFSKVLLVGGEGVVPAIIDDQIDPTTVRLGGADRYVTSKIVAQWVVENSAALQLNDISVATGRDFPDALAGGAFAGHINSVLLLAYDNDAGKFAVNEIVGRYAPYINHGFILGGTGVISETFAQYIEDQA